VPGRWPDGLLSDMAATAGLRATRLAFSQQRLFLGADRREQMRAALQRYTAAIARHHRQDEVISVSEGGQ
jgi:hypothetical protein